MSAVADANHEPSGVDFGRLAGGASIPPLGQEYADGLAKRLERIPRVRNRLIRESELRAVLKRCAVTITPELLSQELAARRKIFALMVNLAKIEIENVRAGVWHGDAALAQSLWSLSMIEAAEILLIETETA